MSLGLPLLAKLRRAENGKACDLPTFEKLFDDEDGLHRLSHAHVVGNEEAHRALLAESHDEGHHLVAAGSEAEFRRAAKGTGRGTEGEAGGIEQKSGGTDAAEVRLGGGIELGGADIAFPGQGHEDPADVLLPTIQRLETKQVVPLRW